MRLSATSSAGWLQAADSAIERAIDLRQHFVVQLLECGFDYDDVTVIQGERMPECGHILRRWPEVHRIVNPIGQALIERLYAVNAGQ
jgi:hypothetical protein